jgi:hypothetical protein
VEARSKAQVLAHPSVLEREQQESA